MTFVQKLLAPGPGTWCNVPFRYPRLNPLRAIRFNSSLGLLKEENVTEERGK